ncbi:MAG: hypothetical protein QF391_16835, partial [Myxococcota bacterium]|nr:hypothetical protein [Myxococcota bacterium]
MRANALFTVFAFSFAAATAQAQQRCPAVELLYDELENLAEKRLDSNKDCKHDQFVYYVEGKPERAAIDSNH